MCWVLVISRTVDTRTVGICWEAETPSACGGAPVVLQRPTQMQQLTCQQWEGSQRGKGWTELSLQEKVQVNNTAPACPQLHKLISLGSPTHCIPHASGTARRYFLRIQGTPANSAWVRRALLPDRQRETLSDFSAC